MKKLSVITALLLSLVLALSGCGAVSGLVKNPFGDQQENVPETEQTTAAVTEAQTTAVPQTEPEPETSAGASNADLSGYWWDAGGRWGIDISQTGNSFNIVMDGAGSAFTTYETRMTGHIQGSQLVYSDGTEVVTQYDEKGNTATIVNYRNGRGQFYIDNNDAVLNNWPANCSGVLAKEWDTNGGGARGIGGYLVWIEEPNNMPKAVDEYIFWYSSDISLSESELAFCSPEDLRIARNEIYARHGRKFTSEDLQQHFNSCSWYNGTIAADKFNDNQLSRIEKDNLKLLEKAEGKPVNSGKSSSAGNSGSSDCLLKGLVNDDLLNLYLAGNNYSSGGYHSVYDDAYMFGDWVGNIMMNANGEIMNLANNINNTYEWCFGTDIGNNFSNNFRYYYANYYALKNYYNTNGNGSVDTYNQLCSSAANFGQGPEAVKALFNDLQPLITACNNEVRKKKGLK